MSGAEAVKVIVRCRPINKRELDLKCKIIVDMLQGVTCNLSNPSEPNTPPKFFTFDGAYGIDSTTEQIYNDVGFALVESVLEGYNGTVFAYGQTGCGKSFTMQGITDPPAQRGIIPRSFEHIFEVIQTSEDMKFLVHASYLEIYNEEIRDLLGADTKKKLDLNEDPEKGVYIKALSRHSVHNTAECEALMEKGWSSRSTGATLMNAESSRSHSIFTIELEMMNTTGESDAIRSGKLNLVDLAGSERQGKTGATGDRLKEATKINLSLSALGNVISALVDGKSKHIPYRDSKLTRLLQNSLGGNTKTLMVACLSPADNNYEETLSTLRYANRAKNIKNKPKINEDPKDAMLREYQDEIRKLREMLDKQGPLETVISVAPDEAALEKEREKVRSEYEMKMQKMKKDVELERESKAVLQANMEKLKSKYESELQEVNRKIQEKQIQDQNRKKSALILDSKKHAIGIETMTEDGTIVYEDVEEGGRSNTPIMGVVKMQNAGMMTSMREEALKKLKMLESNMVGGEKSQDKELKAKRTKRKKYLEKRKKILSEALKNVDDEDGIMLKVYDDIHEELKAKTELAKKQKQKIKSMEAEIQDLSEEFQNERTDYLETIRKQDQQVKLLQSVLERVQPTIRRDCNYSDLDSIKKEAIWDDEYQRWKVPDLTVVKTKLPPAAGISGNGIGIQQVQQGGRTSKMSQYPASTNAPPNVGPTITTSLSWGGTTTSSYNYDSSKYSDSFDDTDSQEEGDPYLQKLQRGAAEDIAGSYFKPKRAKELLVKFKGHATTSLPERTKKFSSSNNLNNLNASMNNATYNSQGSSHNSMSWGPSSSINLIPAQSNMTSTYGGSGPALNSMGNVMSNGWLGDNGYTPSSLSPEESLRRPNRLQALPTIGGGQNNMKKKSRDVLHTLDLI